MTGNTVFLHITRIFSDSYAANFSLGTNSELSISVWSHCLFEEQLIKDDSVSSFRLFYRQLKNGATDQTGLFQPCPEVIKLFSCSTQLSMKFSPLINVKMPTIVGILTFMRGKNSILGISEPKNSLISWYLSTYEHLKFHAQLSWAWKKFYNLGPLSAESETNTDDILCTLFAGSLSHSFLVKNSNKLQLLSSSPNFLRHPDTMLLLSETGLHFYIKKTTIDR